MSKDKFNICNNCHESPSVKIEFDNSIFLKCKCNAGFFKDEEVAIKFWNNFNTEKRYNFKIRKWYRHERKKNLLSEVLKNRKIIFFVYESNTHTIIEIFNIVKEDFHILEDEVIIPIYTNAGITEWKEIHITE